MERTKKYSAKELLGLAEEFKRCHRENGISLARFAHLYQVPIADMKEAVSSLPFQNKDDAISLDKVEQNGSHAKQDVSTREVHRETQGSSMEEQRPDYDFNLLDYFTR